MLNMTGEEEREDEVRDIEKCKKKRKKAEKKGRNNERSLMHGILQILNGNGDSIQFAHV